MALGTLDLIRVPKPVTVETKLLQAPDGNGQVRFSGHTRLSRSDWGMTAFLPLVGNEVRISLQLTATASP